MKELVAMSDTNVPLDPVIEKGEYHAIFQLEFPEDCPLQGTITNTQIRPGMSLTVQNIIPREDLDIYVLFPKPFLGCGNILEGHGWIDVKETGRFPFQTGLAEFYKIHPHEGIMELPANKPLQMVNLNFEMETFLQLLGEHLYELPASFTENLTQDDKLFYHRGAMNSALRHTAHRIFQPDYVGLAKQFFIEAQVLELLAHQLEHFKIEFNQGQIPNLTAEEHEKLDQCKDLLLAKFAEPPSLIELARAVGLNEFKLKTGFKQKFGNTVYRYLQEYRLEQARNWLQAGERVNEVATRIGYDSLSSFSKAFTARFGLRPSKMRE